MLQTDSAERDGMTQIPTYAVIFRIHFWDDFAQRQLERLTARVKHGRVYVLVDETHGRVDGIECDNILRLKEQDVLDMGLVRAGFGNLLWYNGDYPLYYFAEKCPGYQYYLQVEYDAVLNTDIDDLMARVAADGVHFVATENLGQAADWVWLSSCLDCYQPEEVRNKLICISIFSGQALQVLAERRIAQSERFQAEAEMAWPMCEGFVASEMERSGLRCADLSRYGSTDALRWWPPNLESELPEFAAKSFVHPILDRERYVGSIMKYTDGLAGFINPNSVLHQKLRKLPLSLHTQYTLSGLWKKSARKLGLAAS